MSQVLIKKTAYISFYLQVITGIIDYLALKVEIPQELSILKQLLFLELCVQIVEGIFYYWLITSFHTVDNITTYRYIDWMLTTPTMLFTLIMYISNLKDKSKNFETLVKENKNTILSVLALNAMMLYFGFMGEKGKIEIKKSVYLGFIPFIMYFKIIYQHIIKDLDQSNISKEDKKQALILYWYFFIFWGLYGIAALLPYTGKNISYNILDLFSKNFFGLFLSYMVYKSRINK
jgi:bacteriorhodopsin